MIVVFATNDEFYCNFNPGKFKVCRRCNSLDDDCEEPKENEGCKCDNMEMGKNDDFGEKIYFLIFRLQTAGLVLEFEMSVLRIL